jgi:hypothetical protein
MKQFLVLATVTILAALLSSCTLYQSPLGGRYSWGLGYDYSHEADQGDPLVAPNGVPRQY